MRNFLWNCFQVTGSVDAYLLYRDLEKKEFTDGKDQEKPFKQETENRLES